jgi:hypothetical protein
MGPLPASHAQKASHTRLSSHIWDGVADLGGAKAHALITLDRRDGSYRHAIVMGDEHIEPSPEDAKAIRAAALASMGHDVGCVCWRCRELRAEDVYAADLRCRSADPTKCHHPDDDRAPLSGDGWMCMHCGDLVPAPGDAS